MGKLVVPSPSWFPGYTPDELSRKQPEDPNLSPLPEWIDKGSKPDREEAANYSPATCKLWLNFENIQRVDGLLYEKWFDHSGEKL